MLLEFDKQGLTPFPPTDNPMPQGQLYPLMNLKDWPHIAGALGGILVTVETRPVPSEDNPMPQGTCTCAPRDKVACPHCRAMEAWVRRECEREGQQRLPWEEEDNAGRQG